MAGQDRREEPSAKTDGVRDFEETKGNVEHNTAIGNTILPIFTKL